MLSRLLLSIIAMISLAHAGTSLRIEHPRKPSYQKDLYSIVCQKECVLEIKSNEPGKGLSKADVFESKIKELVNLEESNMLPKSDKVLSRLLYTIEADDGKRKLRLVLGYPTSYKGEEYKKYVSVISRIEELKLTMSLEMQGTER